MRGSTADTRRRELVVGAGEVRRAAVAERRVALVRHVRVRVHVGDVSGRAGRGQTEVVALLDGGEVVQVAAAAVVGELRALLGHDVEVVASGGRRRARAALLRRQRADVGACRTAAIHHTAARVHRRAFVRGRTDLRRRADHQLAELVPFRSAARRTAADAAVALAVVTRREVVRVAVAAVVLEALALLVLTVVEVAVRRAAAARHTFVRRQSAGVG